MTDAAFPDRLTQLRTKWESDPTSRVFLQLAEEYRHLGRVKEALAVLEKGLKEHPGYLSALVAKGRCHLELGDGEAARAVLERVVKQDATQMVANKLLVRAYLETAEPGKARERLDLYTLLNDSDPEIEELRRRIKALDRPAAAPPAEEPPHMDADPFSLEPPAPRREVQAEVFDIDLAPPPALRQSSDDIFALDAAPAAPATPASPVDTAAGTDDGLLFPEAAAHGSRQRYLDRLAAEGLFAFEPPPLSPSPAAAAVPAPAPAPVDESAWLEEAPPSATGYAPAPFEPEEAPFFAPPAPALPEEDLWGDEPEAQSQPAEPPAPEPPPAFSPEPFPAPSFQEPPFEEPVLEEPGPVATATLGELYLRQGHLAEAERIFREVLEREPGNAAAQAGLVRLAPEPAPVLAPAPAAVPDPVPDLAPLEASQLLAGFQPAPGQTGAAEMAARKIFLLNSYLKRLRQGQGPGHGEGDRA